MRKLHHSRIKLFILGAVIVSSFLFISYPYLLKQMGRFLIFEQSARKADVIVVLNGRDTERSLAAVDLYNNGYAKLIVMARGEKESGYDEFWKRVGRGFDRRIFFQRAIEAMGIPENSFSLIGGGVTSTYEEAIVTKTFVKENGYKSILLVTSKSHSKRAYFTFQSVLNKKENEIKITIIPSSYDNFDPDSWWKKEEHAKLVFDEYVRLIYFVLAFRISPLNIISSK